MASRQPPLPEKEGHPATDGEQQHNGRSTLGAHAYGRPKSANEHGAPERSATVPEVFCFSPRGAHTAHTYTQVDAVVVVDV